MPNPSGRLTLPRPSLECRPLGQGHVPPRGRHFAPARAQGTRRRSIRCFLRDAVPGTSRRREKTMKLSHRIGAAALTLGLVGFVALGCDQLQPKPKDDKKDTGGGGGGGGGGPDLSTMITENTPYPGWPKDAAGLKKGWFFEKKQKTAAGETQTKWAVVDQAGDVYKVETNQNTMNYAAMGGKDWWEAIEINKDGTVPAAYIGKPGKGNKIKPIKV